MRKWKHGHRKSVQLSEPQYSFWKPTDLKLNLHKSNLRS